MINLFDKRNKMFNISSNIVIMDREDLPNVDWYSEYVKLLFHGKLDQENALQTTMIPLYTNKILWRNCYWEEKASLDKYVIYIADIYIKDTICLQQICGDNPKLCQCNNKLRHFTINDFTSLFWVKVLITVAAYVSDRCGFRYINAPFIHLNVNTLSVPASLSTTSLVPASLSTTSLVPTELSTAKPVQPHSNISCYIYLDKKVSLHRNPEFTIPQNLRHALINFHYLRNKNIIESLKIKDLILKTYFFH